MRIMLFLLLFIPLLNFAQQNQRTISGSIKDSETGAPISNCKISNENFNQSTYSDENGDFKITINKENLEIYLIIV